MYLLLFIAYIAFNHPYFLRTIFVDLIYGSSFWFVCHGSKRR